MEGGGGALLDRSDQRDMFLELDVLTKAQSRLS